MESQKIKIERKVTKKEEVLKMANILLENGYWVKIQIPTTYETLREETLGVPAPETVIEFKME